jgi:phage terminase small subunit
VSSFLHRVLQKDPGLSDRMLATIIGSIPNFGINRMGPLRNTKHERFAQELVEGKSMIEAYEAAGYKPNRSHASRLVTNGNIRGRVAELQEAAAAETEVTVESLISEAADIQERATKARQYSAAIAALIAKAKLAGRWVERAEQRNSNVNYVVSDQPMTEEEWVAERVTEH